MSLLNMLFRLGTEVAGLNTDLEMIPTDDSDGGDADGSGSEGGDKDENAESSGDGSDDGADGSDDGGTDGDADGDADGSNGSDGDADGADGDGSDGDSDGDSDGGSSSELQLEQAPAPEQQHERGEALERHVGLALAASARPRSPVRETTKLKKR